MYWRQRGKATWMKDSDKNTAYFHARATTREQLNTIKGLRDGAGMWVDQKEQMEGIVHNYFQGLFTSSNPDEGEIDEMLQSQQPRMIEEANHLISQPFTTKEVIDAISGMSPLKSPGPDGFSPMFYHKFWNIIGSNVIDCTLDFLNNLHLPPSLNYTYIVLIPKIKNPERMTEFRPISLCNVLYKIGSKAIANRLKPALDLIISPSQSAFVPNRLITDNVLVAFELNHFIRTNSQSKHDFMTLKLDISKAHDRVEWVFLHKVLLRLGLPRRFTDLILLTVTTVSYSFLMNGLQFGNLQPERVLRQGDPLSHIYSYVWSKPL